MTGGAVATGVDGLIGAGGIDVEAGAPGTFGAAIGAGAGGASGAVSAGPAWLDGTPGAGLG
jgi:hypothetical protein